ALELAEDDELRRRIRLKRGTVLVELDDYEAAAEELTALVPELSGPERLDALVALALAYVWTEREERVLATAKDARALAEELGDESGIAAAIAAESEGAAMRGADGDLDRALELGDGALETWVPGTRPVALTHLYHLHA